jgi:hypothetical protein
VQAAAVGLGIAALALGVPAAAAPGGSASATVLPAAAGAHPAALTLALHFAMICNSPGPGPLRLTLPAAMSVPAAIAARHVLVRGKPAPGVTVDGNLVTVRLRHPDGVLCQSIAPGTLKVTFTAGAGLGNPTAAGTYTVHARLGVRSFTAQLAIR